MINEDYRPEILFPLPPLVHEILNECLTYDPDCRPTFKQITCFLRNCMLRWKIDPSTFPPLPCEYELEKLPPSEFSDLLVLKAPSHSGRRMKSRKYSDNLLLRPAQFSPSRDRKSPRELLPSDYKVDL